MIHDWVGWARMLAGIVLVAGLAAGCSSAGAPGEAEGEDGVVSGTLKLPDDVELPPDTFVEVSLKDVSPLMLAEPIIGQAIVRPDGEDRALPFRLHYDPGLVDPERDYAVEAILRGPEGELLKTGKPVLVVTKRRPRNVVLTLVPIGQD